MEIRNLTEQDLEALASLYRQFWAEESSQAKMLSTFRRLAMNPSYIFLGATEQGALVGSAMGIVCEELYGDCQPFMVVEDVVVDQGCRRNGIGTAMMRELERRAIECGCGYILFVTESERTDAGQFYASLGYDPSAHKGFKKRL